jgi:putative membrane protein
MKHILSAEQKQHLDPLVAAAEKSTGAQIVLAVTPRSDAHTELPWKAFALGAVLAGFAAAAFALWRPSWLPHQAALLAVAATLAGGLFLLLACLLIHPLARVLLDRHTAEREARQYAEALFLERQLFATRQRSAVLLLVSLFERQVVLLPDTGLRQRLGAAAMQAIVARVTGALANGQVARALELGVAALAEALGPTAQTAAAADELPNTVIEEAGA